MKGYILPFDKKGDLGLELPRYNTYVHRDQNIKCPTTKLHKTQN